ncbi:aromatic ring-hydroxylating dioxygenase subunit alpha [Streptomyces ziwulingensis]|uniref:Aromatic ring-hydroxylating dioxygenase subunit alpha n=1 Tax=Streptomyces ziwulingensis TaxID=1045501 RepID=A0ABP9CRN7_9ACTN
MPHATAFARNQWYVAAHAHEVGREVLGRTVLGEPLVLYRAERDGRPVVLYDRCVHRRFPLSAAPSRLDGDRIVCGYHGFTYDTTGTCVQVPGRRRVPRTARVASYPVAERDSLVWVWIGDPARADPDTVPRARHLDSPGWVTVRGMEVIDADHGLLVDNLLDLSHETYLHGGYIGTPEVAGTPITTEVDEAAGVVRVSRHMDDAECPPFYAKSTGVRGRIDRWQDIEYHAPCLYLLHSRVAPTGVVPAPDGGDPRAFHTEITYAITPSDHGRVYDFWAVSRDWAREDAEITEFLRHNNHTVVLQDVDALNLLQRALGCERDGFQELSVGIDAGGLAARRILARLAEEGDSPRGNGS